MNLRADRGAARWKTQNERTVCSRFELQDPVLDVQRSPLRHGVGVRSNDYTHDEGLADKYRTKSNVLHKSRLG